MALSGKNLELALRIRADLQQAIGELKQLDGAVTDTGRKAESSGRDMEKLGGAIGKVAGQLIAAVAGGAFAAWIKGSIDAAAQLQTLAQVAGTSTTQFQKWAVGARTVGVSSEQLSDILKDVNDKVGDFMQTGAGPMADFFNGIAPQIGVTADQFRNLSGADALQLYVSSLEKANLSQADMTFYMEAIANDATKLLPLLSEGGAGMAAWAAEAERLGLILSSETIVQAKEFNQQLDTIGLLTGNVGSQIAAEMLPTLNEMAGLLVELSQDSELASAAADAFGIVLKGLAIAAIGVGSTLASVGRSIGGLAAAAAAAASGEFAQAGEIVRQLVADNEAGAAEAEARINRLINGGYRQAGEKAARANKQIADAQREATLSAKEYQEQQEAAQKASEAAAAAAKKQADDAARAAQQLASQQEAYVAGLERQAATINMTAAQVRAYELAEKGLAGAMRARADAALALIDAAEAQRQADANARTNAGLEAEFLRAAGRDTDAALLEIRTRFAGMRTEFEKAGNEAGLAWLDKLIPVAEAKVRVDDVQREMDRILAEQQRQEQSVNVQQDAGLITELQARERILEIHRETYAQLEQIRPVLAELAAQPGAVGEAAAQALYALDAQAQRLMATTTLLQETLRDGLTTGLTEALTGLARGTMTLREAVSALGQSVLDALTRMAAENLAQSITGGVMGLFGGGESGAGLATGAAAVTTSAGALSAAGATLVTGAAAIQAAAASLAAAGAGSAAGGGVGGLGGLLSVFGGGSGAAAGASTYTGAFGFAEGGWPGGQVRGPGTPTSDSIPIWVSDTEFITRGAVVQQPGMLDLLSDINARGWAAINDLVWHGAARHSTGGLANVPAPALPSPGLANTRLAEPAKNFKTEVANNFRFNTFLDRDVMARELGQSSAFRDIMIEIAAGNPRAFREAINQ